ncbi:hypothetical protein M430DRAFT_231145 [Amorphotheca resinae ATCC 22711]|uniref:Uncharacterized protein n=1 Tax=Amorphotheca resinae ATCC 22711 TaxID=857342 RepID=A0A2T3B3N0_AMORE|nr:hypothetical protein M430DRAFT_231145 [Amorphotheca resinae ATCC 22711]PSS20249.1 hypothetical protein M430DRAFT_231145 [Amorphotheca resinae ATCC 22711]
MGIYTVIYCYPIIITIITTIIITYQVDEQLTSLSHPIPLQRPYNPNRLLIPTQSYPRYCPWVGTVPMPTPCCSLLLKHNTPHAWRCSPMVLSKRPRCCVEQRSNNPARCYDSRTPATIPKTMRGRAGDQGGPGPRGAPTCSAAARKAWLCFRWATAAPRSP